MYDKNIDSSLKASSLGCGYIELISGKWRGSCRVRIGGGGRGGLTIITTQGFEFPKLSIFGPVLLVTGTLTQVVEVRLYINV